MQSVVGLTGLQANQKRKFVVLDNVSGVIKPGRMTLLLGPPGAGKSTLLKCLANKMKHEGCKVWHTCDLLQHAMPFKGEPSIQCAILDTPHSSFRVLIQITGSITYNGTALADFLPQRTAAYIEQTDLHLPELTVRETMDFAARVQGTGHKAGRSPFLTRLQSCCFKSQRHPFIPSSVCRKMRPTELLVHLCRGAGRAESCGGSCWPAARPPHGPSADR